MKNTEPKLTRLDELKNILSGIAEGKVLSLDHHSFLEGPNDNLEDGGDKIVGFTSNEVIRDNGTRYPLSDLGEDELEYIFQSSKYSHEYSYSISTGIAINAFDIISIEEL